MEKSKLEKNHHGYVLNNNKYNHAKLHSAGCSDIKKGDAYTTNLQFKVCSLKKQVLEQWCREIENPFELKEYCMHCKP